MGADLNGRVGETAERYEKTHGGKGFGTRSEEGEMMLEMAEILDLVFLNTCFTKKDKHLITSQIDLILTRERDRRVISNCGVVFREGCVTQHRVLLVDCKWRTGGRKRFVRNRRLMLWELKGQKIQDFRENVEQKMNRLERRDHVNEMWMDMKNTLVGATEEVVGRSNGGEPRRENDWWWNKEIRDLLKRKKLAFKEWTTNNNDEAREQYKRIKREAKAAVREAKEVASRD